MSHESTRVQTHWRLAHGTSGTWRGATAAFLPGRGAPPGSVLCGEIAFFSKQLEVAIPQIGDRNRHTACLFYWQNLCLGGKK